MVWAQTVGGVIGHEGAIPFHVPEDLARFKALTLDHPIIMGRATWDTLPVRPLPGRANVVLTRNLSWEAEGAIVAHTPQDALDLAAAAGLPGPIWVIGGAEVYRTYLPVASRVEATLVDIEAPGDTHAPSLGPAWRAAATEPPEGWAVSRTGTRYRFVSWENASSS
jgi:dihydrofolate reductase